MVWAISSLTGGDRPSNERSREWSVKKSRDRLWAAHRPPIVGMARKRNESETVLHDRRRIRELFALGMGPTEISRAVGCARATVYRAIAPDAALDYCRRSALGEQVERVEEILAVYPLMPAPAIASVVGWTGSLRRLQQVVHPRRRVALQRARDMGSYPMAQPVKCEGM